MDLVVLCCVVLCCVVSVWVVGLDGWLVGRSVCWMWFALDGYNRTVTGVTCFTEFLAFRHACCKLAGTEIKQS
jgi:hypothetical protein